MKHPGNARFHDRLSSFLGWKGPEAIHMAASGFFYTGPNDLVECYHCGVKLKSWKTFHSPYFEHEQWSKSCPCVGQYHITKSYQEFNSTDPGRA